MAHKITPRRPRPAKDAGRDDLAVLFPDRTLRIGDREITMREYRFMEGLRIKTLAEPIIADIAARTEGAGDLTPEQLDAAFAAHPEALTQMMAQACDQPVEWVRDLPASQGEQLFGAWWAVNAGFFVRRVQQRVLLHKARAFAGRVSSTPSSPAATSVRSSSATSTPNVN